MSEAAAFGGEQISRQATDHYRATRRRGISVRKTIDLIIGTWRILHGMRLLHNDRDFAPMAEHLGLREA